MKFWLLYIRKIICGGAILVAFVIYWYATSHTPSSDLQTIQLTEDYALAALFSLYACLLISPLYAVFPALPGKIILTKARKGFGLSAFLFATLHSYFAFFKLLGGFNGLGFLDSKYLTAIILSATALLILTVMAITSWRRLHRALGRAWKPIHRLIYLAGILVLIHALMLGSAFADPASGKTQALLYAVLILLLLQAVRFDKFFSERFQSEQRYSLVLPILVFALAFTGSSFLTGHGAAGSLGIHAQHLQLAQQIANNPSSAPANHYTVTVDQPTNIPPGTNVNLTFRIIDSTTGNNITNFTPVYDKLIHVVIVDGQLQYFAHLHPDFNKGVFSLTTSFPHPDLYHVYLNFQPAGESGSNNNIEQQLAANIQVGNQSTSNPAATPPDSIFTKTFASYRISLIHDRPWYAKDLSVGLETINFHLTNQADQPVNVEQYLGAFGHLVMINEQTYQYVHIHPQTASADPNAHGGADISFVPLGLTGPIQPGVYRIFGQFKINGQVIVADYTIKLE